MKRFLFLCVAILGFTKLHAQDIITFRNGEQVKAKVIKIDSFYVLYKSPASVDSSTSVSPRRKVLLINFADGSKKVFRKKRLKEHFLFGGVNENYLAVKNNGAGYSVSLGNYGYNETITNQSIATPGLQLNYISYHELSPTVAFFNGEGLIYYHNKFTDSISHSSEYQTYYYPNSYGYGFETDNTITHVNSLALFFHYVVGFRFNIDDNLYVSTALEPHIILMYSGLQPGYYTQTNYDSTGQVSTTYSRTTRNASTISAFNINASFGIGYRLRASAPHPLCIEIDISPNIFNSPLYFINTANNGEDGINAMTFHRYTFELSLGYKF